MVVLVLMLVILPRLVVPSLEMVSRPGLVWVLLLVLAVMTGLSVGPDEVLATVLVLALVSVLLGLAQGLMAALVPAPGMVVMLMSEQARIPVGPAGPLVLVVQ
jgi:hypothetical protein